MSSTIKLNDSLVHDAKRYALISNRSLPKQIEYWSRIGKIVENNPDIPFNFIKNILFSLDETKEGEIEEYKFNS